MKTKIKKENKKEKKERKSIFKDDNFKMMMPRLLIAVMVVFLIMYFVSIIINYDPFYKSTVAKNAVVDINQDVVAANALIDKKYQDLQDVADKIPLDASNDDIIELLVTYQGSPKFGDLRYFSDGKVYDINGSEVTSDFDWIMQFANSNHRVCSGEYSDHTVGKSCVAFYIPLVGYQSIDGLASIIEARNIVNVSTARNQRSSLVSIITSSGINLADDTREDCDFAVGNNYYEFMDRISQDVTLGNEVMGAVRENDIQTIILTIDGVDYALAIAPLESADSQMFLTSLSVATELIVDEMSYLRHIVALLAIAIICLGVSLVYAYLYHNRVKQQLNHASFTYPNLDCPNIEQFKINVLNSTRAVSIKKYSIIAFRIRSFKTLRNNIGEKSADEMLRLTAKIFDSFCQNDEAYAYNGEGIFMFLMRYEDDKNMAKRIRLIKSVCGKNQVVNVRGITLKYSVGVCHAFGGTKGSVADMIENAVIACNMEKDWANTPYVVYDMNINEELAREEKIESIMEEGLKNGDFKVFLQPKYNIVHDRLDGAEALVRWFDNEKGDYRYPAEFIRLFESNGFITKLDHYVYLEVLKYFKNEVEKGEKVMPVSINVSRVTASAPDFLDFYIQNKRKSGVGDGFIMLEFTESFATEDVEGLMSVVNELHKNGIRCSLDDFGSGYSSFNVLKSIPFDELKLDRCFMSQGFDPNRDEKMLKTIIGLFKEIGVRVVQEGVETEQMLSHAADYGCDAIQGFYYAKALSIDEYRIFQKTPNSIKYKSKVK